ncbi:MAG: hypothetical protein IJ131_02065 [Eggerthellaceae bacterium]|nr:hypothetical protein [Eggerthellaceae bacterium]
MGSVHYMSAPAVRRGMHIPGNIKLAIVGLGLAALLIASLIGMRIYNDVVNAPVRYAETIALAINEGRDLNLPVLNNYVDSDNNGIREAFASAGYQTIDVDALYAREGEEPDPNSIDLVKIPSDVPYDRSVELFQGNLRRVEVSDAAHFLASTWRFTTYLADGVDLKVKYAHFTSDTIEEAIAAGIAAQGWTDSTFGESGVDQSGNTYQNGTVQMDDRVLHWTVSACPLDEVYNVNGLPENSYYVGARLVQ